MANMASKKACYNVDWEDAGLHPQFSTWVKSVASNRNEAWCKLCCSKFALSNMGSRALVYNKIDNIMYDVNT